MLPDADKAQSSTVDPENNRVVVETTAATDALRNALAIRYGTSAVALLVVPDLGLPDATGRQNGRSSGGGFYGGARIVTNVGACTSGFSWRVGTAHYMLTAGHCTTSRDESAASHRRSAGS
ncbi:hypothetical protein AB0K48_27450 [Nonomuraea sp. NPDC055795]